MYAPGARFVDECGVHEQGAFPVGGLVHIGVFVAEDDGAIVQSVFMGDVYDIAIIMGVYDSGESWNEFGGVGEHFEE